MHLADITIFIVYMLLMLGVGYYFMRKNKNDEDYYLGGRNMTKYHVGLSVVATDVGGGFSIGLGGLGFMMGISGSWMLFTGLVGAWLSAVILVPKVARLGRLHQFFTLPQLFNFLYDKKVALAAGIISLIGYLGFTSSQILAGAKLASATFEALSFSTALILMGFIAVVYTVLGGLKAVIYTDTIQWAFLMIGLIFIGLPLAYFHVGGYDEIVSVLPKEYFSLTNVSFQTLINWGVTIVPIWFVGMTLYQRIYASKSPEEAKKAWFIAGLLEWPIMAFLGVLLGLFAKVAHLQGLLPNLAVNGIIDPEMGLPVLLRTILPAGLMGIMMASYFSAILSTADSCLMAASGNLTTDILGKSVQKFKVDSIRVSQVATLFLGILALSIAFFATNVLSLMLYSYAFMVSGLLVPLIGGLFFKINHPKAAIMAMVFGGVTTVLLSLLESTLPFGLDANVFGITTSAMVYIAISYKIILQKIQFKYL
jgi:SSS family solute:Na+ symporter